MKTNSLRRSLSLLLSVLMLCAALVAGLQSAAAGDGWLLHYDFSGADASARLANKADGDTGALTLTGADSAVREGAAFVSTKQGNYLSAPVGADVKQIGSVSTFFLCFRAEGDNPNNAGDIAQIGNVFRIALEQKNRIFLRLGDKFATSADTQRLVASPISRNTWIRLALTLEIDGTTVKETLHLSADEGKTWSTSEFTVTGVNGLYPAAGELLLGKVSKGIPDRGTSFSYRDVRLTNRALTVEELKQLTLPAAPADPSRSRYRTTRIRSRGTIFPPTLSCTMTFWGRRTRSGSPTRRPPASAARI